MRRICAVILSLSALLAASCASVQRDAGIADVRGAVHERTGQTIDVRDQPLSDSRLRELLEGELTADRAVAVALANNARLQSILAGVGIARAALLEASVVRNPLFEVEIRFPSDPIRPFELRLAQTLVDLIQLPRRRALARVVFEAARTRISAEVIGFASSVRAQHAELLAAAQRVALSRTSFEAARTAAELAARQHDAQNITDLDLENQQAHYEQAKLDLAREEEHLLVAREVLVRSMGLGAASIDWRLPAAFPQLPPVEQDQQQLEQVAAARRLDLALARADLDLARRRVPLARLAVLGDITVDGHYQRDASGARTAGPGIEVPIPLFNTGVPARSRAEFEYVRAQRNLEALLAESSSQLREARSIVAEARARVEYYRDVIVPRRQRIVQLTTLEHNAMLVGVFQLLQAKENETQARRDFIGAQRDYWIARNDLDSVLNGVTDARSSPYSVDSTIRTHGTTSPEGGH